MSGKTSVVIIGAGGAGVGTAKALDAKLDPTKHELTLIGASDYYFHLPAALRAVVTAEGNIEKDMTLPYDKLFGKNLKGGKGRVGHFLHAKVVGIEERSDGEGGSVVLDGGKRISWDILVIASGSEWNGPLRWPTTKDEVTPYLDTWREKFATAKSVVIAGAGAVGTELAGEIKDFYPGTEVTVVNRGPLVLNDTYPASFRRRLVNGLTERGVKVILDDEVTNLSPEILDGNDQVTPGRKITTKKGVNVSAELIIPTTGRRGVNTSFLQSSATTISAALGPGGHLQVSQTLQLTTNPKVFAVGDVVALPEQHTLIKAGAHAPIVANNILVLLGGQKGALKEYRKAMDGIAITNGRFGGALYLDFFKFFGYPIIIGNWLTSKIKSGHLLVGIAKGILNAN